MRIDRWIRFKFGKIPQGLIEKYLRSGKIKLNKKKIKSSQKISTKDNIDLFELNEAFAVVVLHYMQQMDIAHEQINVNGGAIAMGHPLGATGGMVLGTLIDEMERRDLNTGLVNLCIGGGMGTSTIVERV